MSVNAFPSGVPGNEPAFPAGETPGLLRDDRERELFLEDALRGLGRRPRELPCKYFYDQQGSNLFDQICELDEYYLTRTEKKIMERHAAEMAAAIGPGALLIEYGSGSSVKTRYLLDHLRDVAAYVPVDISRDHLLLSAARLARAYPAVPVLPVVHDFTEFFDLPDTPEPPRRRVVYFPGSTIGNLEPKDADNFLRSVRRLTGPGGGLLIGVDLKKDQSLLEAAYNDRRGVTAAFNQNLLVRMNRELGSDFDLDQFRHRAFYDARRGRIEMHLVSLKDQTVHLGGRTIRFREGETIRTEYSHKYSLEQFRDMASRAGFEVRRVWTDEKRAFSVQYLEVGGRV